MKPLHECMVDPELLAPDVARLISAIEDALWSARARSRRRRKRLPDIRDREAAQHGMHKICRVGSSLRRHGRRAAEQLAKRSGRRVSRARSRRASRTALGLWGGKRAVIEQVRHPWDQG